MKIMSLNVNRFSGMEERDYTESITSLGKCPKANEIIAFVKGFLWGNPDGVVFLQEIPYMRNKVTRRLYDNFKAKLSSGRCKVILPTGGGVSCTLAITQESSTWDKAPCVFVNYYQNKYVCLKNKSGLCILGIHAPLEGGNNTPEDVQKFFTGLKEYAEKHRDKKLIILGDMNVHSKMPCPYFATFDTIRTETEDGGLGYCDKIPDGKITYFPKGTTLDHVLVSPSLKDSVTAEVKSQSELELSDHAVIIVNIEE